MAPNGFKFAFSNVLTITFYRLCFDHAWRKIILQSQYRLLA